MLLFSSISYSQNVYTMIKEEIIKLDNERMEYDNNFKPVWSISVTNYSNKAITNLIVWNVVKERYTEEEDLTSIKYEELNINTYIGANNTNIISFGVSLSKEYIYRNSYICAIRYEDGSKVDIREYMQLYDIK